MEKLNHSSSQKPIWLRALKWLAALGLAGAIVKAITEKGVGRLVEQAESAYVGWTCGLQSKHDMAAAYQVRAYESWKRDDQAGFTENYSKALVIYEQTLKDCKSKEAGYQLGLAYCKGYGAARNTNYGRTLLDKIADDPRVLELKKSNPAFCLD